MCRLPSADAVRGFVEASVELAKQASSDTELVAFGARTLSALRRLQRHGFVVDAQMRKTRKPLAEPCNSKRFRNEFELGRNVLWTLFTTQESG